MQKPETASDIRLESAQLADKEKELAARHEAELAAIHKRRTDLEALQAPLNTLLSQRTALQERISAAIANRVALESACLEWREKMELVWGQNQGLASYIFLHRNRPELALAASALVEAEAFITRRRTDLVSLEQTIRSYAEGHALRYLLPSDLAN